MAWCRQAASQYLSQCWPRFTSPCGVTRPQWVNTMHKILNFQTEKPLICCYYVVCMWRNWGQYLEQLLCIVLQISDIGFCISDKKQDVRVIPQIENVVWICKIWLTSNLVDGSSYYSEARFQLVRRNNGILTNFSLGDVYIFHVWYYDMLCARN